MRGAARGAPRWLWPLTIVAAGALLAAACGSSTSTLTARPTPTTVAAVAASSTSPPDAANVAPSATAPAAPPTSAAPAPPAGAASPAPADAQPPPAPSRAAAAPSPRAAAPPINTVPSAPPPAAPVAPLPTIATPDGRFRVVCAIGLPDRTVANTTVPDGKIAVQVEFLAVGDAPPLPEVEAAAAATCGQPSGPMAPPDVNRVNGWLRWLCGGQVHLKTALGDDATCTGASMTASARIGPFFLVSDRATEVTLVVPNAPPIPLKLVPPPSRAPAPSPRGSLDGTPGHAALRPA
ncbi:MAG: hypothetical protein U0893_25145 [Chloroflexota bacterium]